MELTIEQALQQGIAAHKEGKLQDAERLYRSILQSQPGHPDANHNLGVLAVSVNKTDTALPLFKSALEANPKIEQFWLSYIDALIKEKQFDNAKQVIRQAKTEGVGRDRLNSLESQLTLINKRETAGSLSPSQEQLSNLLEYYENGHLDDAEKLAVSFTQEFPKHQFAWKVLGAVLGATGRTSEAVDANQTAVALSPGDAGAHSNLGNMLRELGRLDEAEAICAQAIALKPDLAEAHNNLGGTLQELGRLDEAEASFTQAIAVKPDYAEAHSNLGITLQELGRLDEAEASYNQAIALKPSYAEARFNLGITLQELGRLDEAEASLKQAIALKPNYAEAHYSLGITLGELGRLEEAEASYTQAIFLKADYVEARNNLGVTLQELGRLDEAEASYTQTIALSPDYAEAHSNLGNTLKELGRFNEAVASYAQAITLNPDYAEAHYNFGVALQELGRLDEAEASYNQTIALSPDYAEAHSNLGNTLKELGRLDEARASYSQAIALNPDYAEAYSNLGVTLQEQGRLNEAEASFIQAIALKPDYAEAHSNLGVTLQEQGRLNEAEASFIQAIALNPDYAEAYSNLGVTLQEQGRLNEAEASFIQAIALKPDYAEAMLNLSITRSYMNNLEAEIVSLQNVLRIDSDAYGLRAGVSLAICNFLDGDFTESKKQLLAATKIQEKTSPGFKNERVYWRYLSDILKWHGNKYLANKKEKNDANLYVLGESHSLTSHHLRIQNPEIDFFCSARLIKGCKQWHLGNAYRNQYKHLFERIFCALPNHSYVLLAIGEIDCRLETGIIAHKKKFPEKQLKEIILTTVENYLTYIVNNNSDCQHKVFIQGVPCPNIDIRSLPQKDIKQLVEVVKIFNYELKVQSKEKGFRFLDTYQLTNNGDGLSTGFWHMDDYHLSPEGMQEAWRRYAFESSC